MSTLDGARVTASCDASDRTTGLPRAVRPRFRCGREARSSSRTFSNDQRRRAGRSAGLATTRAVLRFSIAGTCSTVRRPVDEAVHSGWRRPHAISRADLVVVPTQGSQLDASEAAKAIKLIRQQEKAFAKRIPYAVLFTRTSAALKPRTLRHIQEQFTQHGIRAFETQIHERDTYRAVFSFGGTLAGLNAGDVSNIDGAVENARAFAAELIAMLREISTPIERVA